MKIQMAPFTAPVKVFVRINLMEEEPVPDYSKVSSLSNLDWMEPWRYHYIVSAEGCVILEGNFSIQD